MSAVTPLGWTPAVLAHTGLALGSMLLGAWLLRGVKGNRAHRLLGWLWVLMMAGVAGLSFALQSQGRYSWIHGLSVLTLGMLVLGVSRARAHQVQAHRRTMRGLYAGALLITGLFTLLPHRLLGQVVWGWLR